jgi:hypothetical protein
VDQRAHEHSRLNTEVGRVVWLREKFRHCFERAITAERFDFDRRAERATNVEVSSQRTSLLD